METWKHADCVSNAAAARKKAEPGDKLNMRLFEVHVQAQCTLGVVFAAELPDLDKPICLSVFTIAHCHPGFQTGQRLYH